MQLPQLGPMDNQVYVTADCLSSRAAVVDPGWYAPAIDRARAGRGLFPAAGPPPAIHRGYAVRLRLRPPRAPARLAPASRAPLLAQGPGACRTRDYPCFGLGLALLTLAAIALLVPMI